MRWTNLIRNSVILILFVVGIAFGSLSLVFGQETEQEPNSTCATAQDFGDVVLPFTLNGSLDSTPTSGDVDFFRFSGTAGTSVQVDLAGQSSGKGTLGDPLLGLFDSDCNLITSNDDSAGTLDARLVFTIPASGSFVLAATSSPDFGFIGNAGVSGSYQLTITPVVLAGSISGRVIDADTGSPLPGSEPTFASVALYRCTAVDCSELVNSQATDSEGKFRFDQDFSGNPLATGTYQVQMYAYLYEPGQTEPFDIGEGEDRDLGDIALTATPLAGSISGRVVDAGTGTPLPGMTSPFAFVELYRCIDGNCVEPVQFQPTDSEGRFRFGADASDYPAPLPAGTYQIFASAQEYQRGQTEPFTVGEGEEIDVGDIALEPLPIQFSEIRPCGNLPPEGGLCRYSMRVTNRSSEMIDGATWSLVGSFGTGSLIGSTFFQPDEPYEVRLAPGQSTVVRYSFRVPPSVQDGAYVCAQAFFGQDPINPFFNTIGQRNLFCIFKGFTGEFSLLPEKEAARVFRQMDQPEGVPSAKPMR